jgi:hypothetical protein
MEHLLEENVQPKSNSKKRIYIYLGIIFFILTLLGIGIGCWILNNKSSNELKVIYWNLKDFGNKKLDNDQVLIQLEKITSIYDVIIFIELEQSDCDTNDFCDLKSQMDEDFPEHHFFMSPSLGFNPVNNRGKEQYGFLIRKTLNYNVYHFQDIEQVFARPPYYITIHEYNINLATIHTNPKNSEKEVNYLPNFFNTLQGDFVLLGDLNICDPSILDNQKVKMDYNWILEDGDSTNLNLNCAYDRIISNHGFQRYSHAKVLKDDLQAEKILSDHYPLSIKINNYI